MSNHYSDPTANAAIGSADRELKELSREADRIHALAKAGRLTPEMKRGARLRFRGIYRYLLEDALTVLDSEKRPDAPAGPADRELRRMLREAERIRALVRSGKLTSELVQDARLRFRGIYRYLLKDVLTVPDAAKRPDAA